MERCEEEKNYQTINSVSKLCSHRQLQVIFKTDLEKEPFFKKGLFYEAVYIKGITHTLF